MALRCLSPCSENASQKLSDFKDKDVLMSSLDMFQTKLGYRFRDLNHLIAALTHRSYAFEHANFEQNNQRLEFLGDAVLDFVIADFLFEKYPKLREGELSRLRSRLVCEAALSLLARKLTFENEILMGKGEITAAGMLRDGTLADAYEAVIGAIYRDGGIEPARDFILRHHAEYLKNPDGDWLPRDDKTQLQVIVQSHHRTLRYETLQQLGPSHAPLFEMGVWIDDELCGKGVGHSKKEAQQIAAADALTRINDIFSDVENLENSQLNFLKKKESSQSSALLRAKLQNNAVSPAHGDSSQSSKIAASPNMRTEKSPSPQEIDQNDVCMIPGLHTQKKMKK